MESSAEALKVLGLESGASEGDVKIAFRQLSKQYHPDVNKAPEAETKFKEINAAYQFLQKHGTDYEQMKQSDFWTSVQDDLINRVFVNFQPTGFVNFRGAYQKPQSNVLHGTITLSFEESILGTTKSVTYNRKVLCDHCDGKCYVGTVDEEKECPTCNGKGRSTHGPYTISCVACGATGKVKEKIPCNVCEGKGSLRKDNTINVELPPGINNDSIYSIEYVGDYNIASMNKWGPARFKIIVNDDAELKREGNNVISSIELSLLEALKGVKKQVRTVLGEKSLVIQPKRRHLDRVVAKGLGVKNAGDHIFEISVKYPEDVKPLIDVMERKEEDGV